MKKIFIFLLVLLVAFFIFFGKSKLTPPTPQLRLKVGQSIVEVEIADTPAKRERGLSGRESLCENCGLLFLFDASTECRSASTSSSLSDRGLRAEGLSGCRRVDQPGVYPFWMKRMYFNIDILWIRENKVVEITFGANVPSPEEFETPKTFYQSRIPVDSVLEVNAGWVDKNRIKIGDKVKKLQ